ncbi:MAG: superoxide dismutase family protein [Anaeromyxobacteraceae bacterium]
MSRLAVLAAAIVVAVPVYAAPATAHADLTDAKGAKVGNAVLSESDSGVHVAIKVQGLAPGKHGLHVHAAGKCDAPEFMTSGSHFNPGGKKHGLKSAAGAHLGDLPNLEVGADGKGEGHFMLKGVTLGEGSDGLFGPAGSAVVIHEKVDDETSDPGGNSGARIACGVIRRG